MVNRTRRRVRKKWQGLWAGRYDRNPLEHRLARLWQRDNEPPNSGWGLLAYILGDGINPGDVSDRDRLVANTLIQWLGSEVGKSFLGEALK